MWDQLNRVFDERIGLFMSWAGNALAWTSTSEHATVLASVVTALATVVMAWFTWKLTDSIKLEREEFIATHRPKIKVRAFRLHLEGVTADHKYAVEFIYLNEGETAAHIKEIGTVLIIGDNIWNYGARKVRFDIEKSTEKLCAGEQRMQLTNAEFNWDSKDANWFYVGYIEYQDDRGFNRKTGFCRRWNPGSMSWDLERNEEYEYSY
jgi:hypothetical protein